jgi:hypothetical protein
LFWKVLILIWELRFEALDLVLPATETTFISGAENNSWLELLPSFSSPGPVDMITSSWNRL